MPSNTELVASILAIEPDVKTEGLTNPKLAALLKELRAKKSVNPTDVLTQEGGLQLSAPFEKVEPPAEAEIKYQNGVIPEPEPEPELARVYTVAEGKAITSRMGILGPGTEVHAELFVNGEDVIQELHKKGILV